MSTRIKFALDALNIALNDSQSAIEDPRADKEYEHPFGSKGTEPEDVKYGSIKICVACECGDCFSHKTSAYTPEEQKRLFDKLRDEHELNTRLDDHCRN